MKIAWNFCVVFVFSILSLAYCDGGDFSIVIPESKAGKANIPMLFSYDQRCFLNTGATCYASYGSKSLRFNFQIPKRPEYQLQANAGNDGRVWHDDSVEVFLYVPDSRTAYHYVVNANRAIYDDRIGPKGKDASWDGKAVAAVKQEPRKWKIALSIPFTDLGIDPQKGDIQLRGNVGFRSIDKANAMWQFFSPTLDSIYDEKTWATFILSNSRPFCNNVDVNLKRTDGKYRVESAITIKNPLGEPLELKDNGASVKISPDKEDVFKRNVPIESKSQNVSFNYLPAISMKLSFMPPASLLDIRATDIDHLQVKWIGNSDELARFPRAVVAIDNKILYDAPFKDLQNARLDIKDFSEGWHILQVSIFEAGKNQAKDVIAEDIYTIRPTPIELDINKLDVSEYYRPIKVTDATVTAARSEFDFADGPLPTQVKVNGNDTLAKPVKLIFNSQPVIFDKPQIKLISNNQAEIVASGKVNGAKVVLTGRIFYDGFIWYDLKIVGKAMKYGPLALEMATNFTDTLYSHATVYPDNSFSKGSIKDSGSETAIKTPGYDSKVLGRCSSLNFSGINIPLTWYVGVATDENLKYRGMCFATEGPRGWNLSNYNKTYELKKSKAETTLSVNFSDGVNSLTTDEINISFGLQPLPIRKVSDDSNQEYHIDYCPLFMTYWKYSDLKNNKPITLAQDRADKRQTVACIFQEWTESQNYWKTKHDLMMQATSRAVHDAGMLMTVYFGFEMANTIPEFRLYHDLMLRKPTDYPFGGYRRRGWSVDRGFSDANMRAWPVSYSGIWGDRQLRGMQAAAERYSLDGVYLDGTLLPIASANKADGQGLVDTSGRSVVTWNVLSQRRFGEKLYAIGKKLGRKKWIIDLHTNVPCPPAMSLISIYHTGEAAHLFDHKARMNPAMLRGQINGQLYGIPCDVYLRPPYKAKWGFAQSLLVNSFLRLNSGGPAVWKNSCFKIWEIWDKYNLTNQYFVPFFEAEKKIKRDNKNVRLSYFDTGKHLMIVASNYWLNKPQKLSIDLSAFSDKYDLSNVKDIWNNSKLSVAGHDCVVNIPAEDFCLLLISSKK